ncbi:MAG: amidase family protein, partial [Alphaproteobacteria bacterium]|nr:amidase family protein [Alphaproteobacteria bacterium]
MTRTLGSDDEVGAFVPHAPFGTKISGTVGGPLHGLTFAVKDLFDVKGLPTGGGSPEWLATHERADETAPAVAALLEAGAELVGKTVCDEFFYSLTGANAHYGTPTNMAAPGRLPGGSSSGSAAAVAAEMCDFALGSDTGGSVRIPAAFCGLYGLRPTHGR